MVWPILLVGVTGAYTAYSQQQAAKQQQYDIERQAEVEKLSAQTEELKRRERLNKVLAANVESVASSGFLEGNQQSIALQSAKVASQSEAAESVSERIREDLRKRQAKQAGEMGKARATSTLLNTGMQASSLRGG